MQPPTSSGPRRGADKSLVDSVQVFDVFQGEAVGDGRKSVAIEVVLQPRDATLTEADLETVSNKIVTAVKKATNAEIRG